MFTYVCWYLLSVDDDINLRVIQQFLQIKFWLRLKPLKQLWCGGQEGTTEPTGRRWGSTGKSYKQGH